MTKARQKGVRKENEMKIKVRETSRDHQGYIEWIEKFDFKNLPVEDRRTMKNERRTMKNGGKSSRNRSRKRLGSVTEVPRLGFSSRNQFFSLILSESQIPGGLNIFVRHPARLGELGCFLQKAPSFGELPGRPNCTPLFTKCTPCLFLLILFP